MTTAREVLALVITGDSRGAISEIEKVGSASQRELGNTQARLDQMGSRLTTWGAASVGTGALAAAGLYTAAVAAGQLDANIGRIEGNFGAAADQALAFVENANGIGLSDQQAAQYVANIGELAVGLGIGEQAAAGMTTETVRLVSQLALLKGQTPAEALEAVSAGLIGEYDSLQRLVPAISAAAIEEKALADTRKASADELTQAEKATATFAIITKSAQETLGRSGDVTESNAFKAAQLAASYEDLKTSLGEGALPVLDRSVSLLTRAAEGFNTADDATNGWLSGLATVATVGALAGGGLSFVAGQGIKLYQALTDVEGGFNRVGRAAAGMSVALVGIGAGVAVVESLNRSAVGAAGSVEELQAALADSSGTRLTQVLDQVLLEIDGKADSIGDVVNGLLTNAKLDLGGFFGGAFFEDDRSLKAVKDDLEALASIDPAGAEELLDAIERAVAADPNFFPNDGAREEWDEVASALRRTVETQRLAASSTGQLTGETERNTAAASANADALKERLDPVLGLLDAQQRLADAEKRMAEAANTNSREVQQANRGLADARERVVDATRQLSDAQAELNDVLNDDPLFGLRSESPEDQIADARARLAEANRLLAENPGNALALTMRDEAVLDLESASRRQQEQRRAAEQRAEDIANAQRAVEDARRGLDDANQGVVDAQGRLAEVQSKYGLDSEEYRRAAQDVIEANLAVQVADGELADFVRENGVAALGELNDQLDRWIEQGGPVGEAAAIMKAQLEPLVQQYLILGGALGAINQAVATGIPLLDRYLAQANAAQRFADQGLRAFPIFGDLGLGRRGPESANPGQAVPTDEFGIPLYGRSAGGPITGVGTGTSDDVLVAASPGEFMLKKSTVAALGPAAVAQVNQTGRWPEIVRSSSGPASVVREGDLVMGGVNIVMQARDDQLAGEAVVHSLRQVARRAGRGTRPSPARKL